jgi:hypothetical protein
LLLSAVPGVFLTVASVAVLMAAIIGIVHHPEMIVSLMLLAIPFGILWGMWLEIPSWFRRSIYRLLRRKRERHDEGGE